MPPIFDDKSPAMVKLMVVNGETNLPFIPSQMGGLLLVGIHRQPLDGHRTGLGTTSCSARSRDVVVLRMGIRQDGSGWLWMAMDSYGWLCLNNGREATG